MKIKDLRGKTAVIVGASSGIGKAIALTLAREGMHLVLAARRETVLQQVASECESLGGTAVAVECDVTIPSDLEDLVDKAKLFYDKIDVWINNAGVMCVGEFTETPLDAHEQVILTDLLGPMYSAYAIVPYFKQRGFGTLINTVSIGSFVPNPFATAYSAAKFGLRGFLESLRAELVEYPGIDVCEVHPAFIDTPGIIHAANYSGKDLTLAPPVYDPFQVAATVKKLILNPKRSVMVGGSARVARFFYALAPSLFTKSLAKAALAYFKVAKPKPLSHGNLFSPVYKGVTARGGNMKRVSVLKKIYDQKFLSA